MSTFRPYDPRGEFSQSWRNLPHWEQPGATYFVTFRLADALPLEARQRIAELNELNDTDAFAWIERYLDSGAGSRLLAEPSHARRVESTLRYFDRERYALGSYAIMPNHVHALMQPNPPFTRSKVVHSWKSFSAHEIQRRAGIVGQVWQDEGFDRIVRNEAELRKYHDYILANPAAANLPSGTFLIGKGLANWLSS